MKKFLAAFLILASLSVSAKKLEPWQDPEVYEQNRLPMRASFVTDQQQTQSLNGRWRFHWSETVASRLQGFEAVNYDDSRWGEMPVPGLWSPALRFRAESPMMVRVFSTFTETLQVLV